jgi:hypothetical protein
MLEIDAPPVRERKHGALRFFASNWQVSRASATKRASAIFWIAVFSSCRPAPAPGQLWPGGQQQG